MLRRHLDHIRARHASDHTESAGDMADDFPFSQEDDNQDTPDSADSPGPTVSPAAADPATTDPEEPTVRRSTRFRRPREFFDPSKY